MSEIKLRLAQLLEKPLKFHKEKDFDNFSKESEIMALMPDLDKLEEDRKKVRLECVSGEMQASYQEPLLTKEQELHLFRQFNFLKYKACKLLRKNIKNPKEQDVELIENLLKKSAEIKRQLVCSNARLVVNIAKKQREYWLDKGNLFELVSDGNFGLVRAADYFDYRRGTKFCTYAYFAIVDTINDARRQRTKHAANVVNDMETVLLNEEDHRVNETIVEDVNVKKILKKLPSREKNILEMYFGLNNSKSLTLREIGRELNISQERVRQLREQGLSKLREWVPISLVS